MVIYSAIEKVFGKNGLFVHHVSLLIIRMNIRNDTLIDFYSNISSSNIFTF